MPANVALFLDDDLEQEFDELSLGEVLLPRSYDDVGEGQPYRIHGHNTGTTVLREVVVRIEGPGKSSVQLALSVDDEPGVWAAPGESIIVVPQSLFPGQTFSFWSRGVYKYEDDEDRLPFKMIINATSVG